MNRIVLAAAIAATLVFPALSVAHAIDETTTVSLIRSRATVDPGDVVVVFGRVRSADASCVRGKLVRLYLVRRGPDRAIASDRSDLDGDFGFRVRVRHDSRFYARFAGSFASSYGHSHVCHSDSSRAVFVNVRGR